MTTVPIPESHLPGTLVMFRDALHVVVAESRGKHRLFPLGGSDRYIRNVLAAHFQVIDPARVTISDA